MDNQYLQKSLNKIAKASNEKYDYLIYIIMQKGVVWPYFSSSILIIT